MSICKDCLHYDFCENPRLTTQAELESTCKYYKNERNYYELPAYVGLKIWVPWVLINDRVHITEVREGKVSGLQQKADGTWKIRCSYNGSVSDYTIVEFKERIFLSEESAWAYVRAKEAELTKK